MLQDQCGLRGLQNLAQGSLGLVTEDGEAKAETQQG